MQIFVWVAFLIAIGIAFFAIQNSNAPLVMIKFLFWKFETSLVYTILGSIVLGILLPILIWVPRAIRESFRKRDLSEGLNDHRRTDQQDTRRKE